MQELHIDNVQTAPNTPYNLKWSIALCRGAPRLRKTEKMQGSTKHCLATGKTGKFLGKKRQEKLFRVYASEAGGDWRDLVWSCQGTSGQWNLVLTVLHSIGPWTASF